MKKLQEKKFGNGDIKKVKELNVEENVDCQINKKKKIFYLFIEIIVLLLVVLVFSTVFAMIHGAKNTIANGLSIKNIDISKLTYEEARKKIEDILDIELKADIDLKYNDYLYTMKSDEISLRYDISDVLDEAYGIGRNQNIIKNNYSLIFTSFLKKNIDYSLVYNEQELDKVIEHIAASVPGLTIQYSYYIENDELIINPGTNGVQVNKEE